MRILLAAVAEQLVVAPSPRPEGLMIQGSSLMMPTVGMTAPEVTLPGPEPGEIVDIEPIMAAIERGWRRSYPDTHVQTRVASLGGAGFALARTLATPQQKVPMLVQGFSTAEIPAVLLIDATDTQPQPGALVQPVATIDTFQLQTDFLSVSSYGVGQMLRKAVQEGAKTIRIGISGAENASIVADAGMQLWAGLMDQPPFDVLDQAEQVQEQAERLRQLHSQAHAILAGVQVELFTTASDPLIGRVGVAERAFASQYLDAAAAAVRRERDKALSELLGRDAQGQRPALQPGSGAGGGIGFALLHLGAELVDPYEKAMDVCGITEEISRSDLVVTTVMDFSWQSLYGSELVTVGGAALEQARACVALAGQIRVGRREYIDGGLTAAYAAIPREVPDWETFQADPPAAFEALAQRIARTWSLPS